MILEEIHRFGILFQVSIGFFTEYDTDGTSEEFDLICFFYKGFWLNNESKN